jgi:hypothetical protein
MQCSHATATDLHEEAEHGEHGQAAVLDLLDLQLSEGVGVVSQAQGVERLAGVQRVQALAGGAAVHAVALNQAHQDDLRETVGGQERERQATCTVRGVLQASVRFSLQLMLRGNTQS